MASLRLILAAISLIAVGDAAPLDTTASKATRSRLDAYKMYTGTVSSADWPAMSQWWNSFDDMFQANRNNVAQSCTQFGVPVNTVQEDQNIARSIKAVAAESGVDARFIFAVLLQESMGCVRAPTTNYGVRNPGLMQSHNGVGTCNDQGNVVRPCPYSSTLQMVRDGVEGTPSGDGLKQLITQAPGNQNTKYYAAARMYNSGSIASSGILEAGIATHCYASDIANRLVGWVSAHKTCTLDGQTSAASAAPVSSPTQPAASQPTTAVRNTQTGASSQAAQASNMAPGVTSQCSQYYRVQSGDYCQALASKFGTTVAVLRQLNTNLDSACSNLWLGYDYCVHGL